MVELFEIKFPQSVQELDTFTSRKNLESLISLYKVFWENCCKGKDAEDKKKEFEPGLDLSTIQTIRDGVMDRSRDCQLKY